MDKRENPILALPKQSWFFLSLTRELDILLVSHIFSSPESRETAYIYGISSAGVMYSVTRACAKGELDHCGCDVKARSRNTDGQFEWGGCSENVRYGSKFSKDFIDTTEADFTENGLMNRWNNEAGRKVSFTAVSVFSENM